MKKNNELINEKVERQKKAKKIRKIIIISLGISLFIIGFFLFAYCRQIFGDEIANQILGGPNPEKGEYFKDGFEALGNLFSSNAGAILGSLIIVGVIVLVTTVINLLISLCFRRTPRSRTIGSLLRSLIKYVAIVIAICSILANWGVNIYGIFAGVGVLSLIIGLGCKSLVNDIVSGFFIVVDNYFQVDDRVIIDDFTGDIFNIGLRTTKVRSWDGNLKCINNSLITSVVNLSRYTSKAIVKLDISFNEDLQRVEAIVLRNLNKISEKIPEISSPLSYEGVDCLDECGVCLIFMADVFEKDRIPACRKILRELYLLCVREDIIIPFKQLVVNQPDPINRIRASEDDLLVSNERFAIKEQETDNNAKKNIFDSIKKAVKDADKELYKD